MIFFLESKSKKKILSVEGGEEGWVAGISEFVLL